MRPDGLPSMGTRHHAVNNFPVVLFMWCCQYCITNYFDYYFEVSYYGANERCFCPPPPHKFFTGLKDSSRASRDGAPLV